MTRFLARRHARILVTLAAAILSPALSQAASLFWDGTGSSWNLTGPWSTSSSSNSGLFNPVAPPGSGDIATFNITTVNTAQTVNLDAPQSALGLIFDSTGTVLIESAAGGGSANSLTLGASGITHGAGAGADTISAPVILSAPQTWVNNSSGIFTASGGVNLQTNGLTIDGAATTTISSALSGTGGVTKNGSAALRLNASNSFTGGLTIDAGPVILGNAGALNSTAPNAVSFGAGSAGALTLNGNSVTVSGLTTSATVGSPFVENKSATPATLTVSNSSDNTYAGLLQDSAGGGALSLTKSGAGTLTLVGANTYTGVTTISAGALQLNGAGALTSAGSISIATTSGNSGTLALDGASASVTQAGASTLTVGNSGTGTAMLNIATTTGDATFTTGTGLTTIRTTGTVSIGNGSSTGSLAANGSVTIDGGALQRDSGSTFALAAGNTMSIQNGGRASFTGDYTTATIATYNIGGTNSKFETLGGGSFNLNNSAQVNVTASGLLALSGNVAIGNGTSGTLSVNGVGANITQTGAGTLTVGHAASGTAAINIGTTATGGTLTTGTGLFTINKTGTVTVGSASTNGTLNANGDVTIDGGVLQVPNPAGGFTLAAGKTMTIQNGGRASFTGGYGTASNAVYNIIGAGSRLDGSLGIFNGAQVNVSSGGLASGASLDFDELGGGTLSVDGSGSSVVSSGGDWGAIIGTNTITFSNIATGTFNGEIDVGDFDLSNHPGSANINVTSGAKVSVGGNLLINDGLIGGSCTLNIQGAGSTVTTNNLLSVGGGFGNVTNAINIGTTSSGAVLNTGEMFIDGTVTIGDGANDGTLNANGDVFVSGGVLQTNSAGSVFGLASGKSMTIQLGGRVTLNSNSPIGIGSSLTIESGGTATLNSNYTVGAGSSLIIDGGGMLTVSALVVNTGGTFTFNSGTLGITGAAGLTLDPTNVGRNFTVDPNHNLNVTNTTTIGSTDPFSSFSLIVAGGTFNTGNLIVNRTTGLFIFNSGTLGITGPAGLTIGAFGLLGPNPTITSDKTLNVTATTTIDSGSTLTVSGGTFSTGALSGGGTFNFVGFVGSTLAVTGAAGLTIGSGSVASTAFSLGPADHVSVTNLLRIAADGRLTNPGGNVTAGSMLIDTGGRWTVSDGVQSVGTGLVNHGTLLFVDTTINGPVNSPAGSAVNVIGNVAFNQLVSGAGQFFGSGTATFNGGYSPGDSPASINFQGGVALGTINTLSIEIGGTTPGNGPNHHDQVNVAGTAALDGTLALAPFNGFVPVSGDKFIVMTYANETGTFSSITGTSPAPGLTYSAVYQPTSLVIITTTNGDKTWGVDSNGNSSAGSNWLGGVAPGGVGDSAAFTTIVTAPRIVTVDTDTTVGTLKFDSSNNYTIAGPHTLTLQAAGATAATINVSGVHGNGAHTISAPVTLASDLNITQNSGGVFTISGPLNNAAGKRINVSGSGATAITGSINLGNTTSLLVSGTSTMRFALTSGSATIGTGVTATVASGATLELAGSVSALGTTGGNRVHVVNNSTSSGVVVSGTNQVVGAIDGSGTTQVNAGSDLTAEHIIQDALIIGGTAGSTGLVTIDASDASGNPMNQPSGSALDGFLVPSGPSDNGVISSANLSSGDSVDLTVAPMANSVGGNPSPVPEPSTLLLTLLAVLGVVRAQFVRHHFRCQTV